MMLTMVGVGMGLGELRLAAWRIWITGPWSRHAVLLCRSVKIFIKSFKM